jgi:hypothetical protein
VILRVRLAAATPAPCGHRAAGELLGLDAVVAATLRR